MHPEAYEGFGAALEAAGVDRHAQLTVLDIGGQNVNGSVHGWLTHPKTTVVTLDLENADIIADARTWTPTGRWDLIICTEVFEHVEDWPAIIRTARAATAPWGAFVATCASTNRPQHGATGAPLPAPGEWYRNVDPEDLRRVLLEHFQRADVVYRYPPGDAYMWGTA
jgi:hypothetical protein